MLWKVVLSLCAAVGVTTAGVVQGIAGGVSSRSSHTDGLGNFAFNYQVRDGLGATKSRAEAGDVFGNRIGSYSLSDIDGRARHVSYVADAGGFRASVATNEPGTLRSFAQTHAAPIAQVAYSPTVYAAGPAPVVARQAVFAASPAPAVIRAAPTYAAAPVRNLIGFPAPTIYSAPRVVAPAPVRVAPVVAYSAPAPIQTAVVKAHHGVAVTNHYFPAPVVARATPVFVDGAASLPFRSSVPAIDYTQKQLLRQISVNEPGQLGFPSSAFTTTFPSQSLPTGSIQVPPSFPQQPPVSFPNPGLPSFPSQPPVAFPSPPAGFPSQPPAGFPSQPPAGFPSQPPAGFPSQPPAGFPSQPPAGFPSQPPAGFPSQPPAGFPSQPPAGFPSQPPAGFPSQPPAEGPQQPPPVVNEPTFTGDTEEAPADVRTPTFTTDTEQAPANVRTPTFGAQSNSLQQQAQQFSFPPSPEIQTRGQGFPPQLPSFRSGITYAPQGADVTQRFSAPEQQLGSSSTGFNGANLFRSFAPQIRTSRASPPDGPQGGPQQANGPAPRSFGQNGPQGPPPGGNGPQGPPPPGANGPASRSAGRQKLRGIRITTARPVRHEIVKVPIITQVIPVPVILGVFDVPR